MKSFGEVIKSIKWCLRRCYGLWFHGRTFCVGVSGTNAHVVFMTVGFLLGWTAEGCVLWCVLSEEESRVLPTDLAFYKHKGQEIPF